MTCLSCLRVADTESKNNDTMYKEKDKEREKVRKPRQAG